MRLQGANTHSLVLRGNSGTVSMRPVIARGERGEQGLPGNASAAWLPDDAVTTGTLRQAPDGSWIKSLASRTTRASFDATEETFWAATLATAGTIEARALSATFAGVGESPISDGYGTLPMSYTTLVAGMEGETAVGSGATITADTSNFETGDRAYKVTSNSGASEARLRVTPADAPLVFGTGAAICARVYVPDVTKITTVTLDIYGDSGLTFADRWTRINTTVRPLANGWNTLRFPATASSRVAGKWGNAYRVDVIGTNPSTSAGNEFTVDRVWVEQPRKATLLFINDHGSQDFATYGYPGLKALGVPVTFSIDPYLVGTVPVSEGISMPRLTWAQIDTLAAENGNSISAHAYGDLVTSGMTAAQIRADVIKSTKALQARGYTGWIWRSSWWEENAPQYAAAQSLYLGMSTYKSDSGPTCWPPPDWFNIPRYSIYQSRTTGQIDTLFQQLQDCRGHVSMFTHRVAPNPGTYDCDLTKWDYLLGKIEDGIAAGWLEGVTFEQLFARTGGRFRRGTSGVVVAEYPGDDGSVVRKLLP